MQIIGLDLGTRTGWAVCEFCGGEAKVTDCGFWKLRHKPEDPAIRYHDFKRRLVDLTRDADVIAYEIVHRHLGTQAAHLYGGFQAILLMRGLDLDAQVIPVTVQDVKRLATGKGNASKDDIVCAARSDVRLSWVDPTDHNAADACYVALCAAKMAEVDQ